MGKCSVSICVLNVISQGGDIARILRKSYEATLQAGAENTSNTPFCQSCTRVGCSLYALREKREQVSSFNGAWGLIFSVSVFHGDGGCC